MGAANESGIYDGLIGLIQSNKSNLVSYYFPYGVFDHEPGIFVPSPIQDAVPHLYSKRIVGQPADLEVLYVFFNFSASIWFYWVITMTICSIVILLIIQYKNNDPKIKLKKILKRLSRCGWNYAMLLIDQAPTDVSKKVPCTVIWTTIVIAIYYGIHMVFWSTLSADLSAKSPDYWIDSMEDLLYDPRNDHLQPATMKQWNTYRALTQSPKGSIERLLLERIESDRENSLIGIEEKYISAQWFMERILQVLNGIVDGNMVFIEESLYVDNIFSQIFCYMTDDSRNKISRITKSKNYVFNMPAAMIMSHSTHPSVVEMYTYRSLSSTEFGIFKTIVQTTSSGGRAEFGLESSTAAIICAETFLNILLKELEQDWFPMPLYFLKSFIYVCLSIFAMASYVLMYELFSNYAVYHSHDTSKNVVEPILTGQRPATSPACFSFTIAEVCNQEPIAGKSKQNPDDGIDDEIVEHISRHIKDRIELSDLIEEETSEIETCESETEKFYSTIAAEMSQNSIADSKVQKCIDDIKDKMIEYIPYHKRNKVEPITQITGTSSRIELDENQPKVSTLFDSIKFLPKNFKFTILHKNNSVVPLNE